MEAPLQLCNSMITYPSFSKHISQKFYTEGFVNFVIKSSKHKAYIINEN